ncbi:MAG TPA: hypothetical protein VKB50_20555 [Vicinamibacterales bacterium]|nr:hypothetical protein [Vicinamibacterales bacterium]
MPRAKSFLKYAQLPLDAVLEGNAGRLLDLLDRRLTLPSAVLSDGALTVPIYAVASLSLSETFNLPPIGSSGVRTVVPAHDDTISLSGLLVGPDRFRWKTELETLAEVSKRGSALAALSSGKLSGLILVTSLTIRTDIQVQSLGFSVSAMRRDVIEVTLSLAHLPLPGSAGLLFDKARLGVSALADFAGVSR